MNASITYALQACGGCVTVEWDVYLHPILGWIALGLSWFIANSLINWIGKYSAPMQTSIGAALGLSAGALLGGSLIFGPIMALVLGVLAAGAFLFAVLRRLVLGEPDRWTRPFIINGMIHLLIAGGLIVAMVPATLYRQREASLYAAVVAGKMSPGDPRIQTFASKHADRLAQARVDVTASHGPKVRFGARTIALLGSPKTDYDLLLKAREKADYQSREALVEAIRLFEARLAPTSTP